MPILLLPAATDSVLVRGLGQFINVTKPTVHAEMGFPQSGPKFLAEMGLP